MIDFSHFFFVNVCDKTEGVDSHKHKIRRYVLSPCYLEKIVVANELIQIHRSELLLLAWVLTILSVELTGEGSLFGPLCWMRLGLAAMVTAV